jgi:hypothetical protein
VLFGHLSTFNASRQPQSSPTAERSSSTDEAPQIMNVVGAVDENETVLFFSQPWMPYAQALNRSDRSACFSADHFDHFANISISQELFTNIYRCDKMLPLALPVPMFSSSLLIFTICILGPHRRAKFVTSCLGKIKRAEHLRNHVFALPFPEALLISAALCL